uniref:Uncharacterized protein n=1 Tax=Anguilla anguilla TaxID=7936 RepID=A0A0E9VVU0_ANGAN
MIVLMLSGYKKDGNSHLRVYTGTNAGTALSWLVFGQQKYKE